MLRFARIVCWRRAGTLASAFVAGLTCLLAAIALALPAAAEKRVASLPNVPTFAEAGHPLVNDPSWFGLVGPARLAPETVARLHAALVATLRHPEVVKRLDAAASTPVGNSPDAYRKVVADALANTRKVVREANLKFE